MTGVKLKGEYYNVGDLISFNAKIKDLDTRYTDNLQIIIVHVYLNYANRDFKLVWFDKRDLLKQLEVGKKFTFVGKLKLDNKGELCIHNAKIYEFNKSSTKIYHRTTNVWEKEINGQSLKPTDEWELIRQEVFYRDGSMCVKCGQANKELTVDHIKPKGLGGGNTLDNLQTLCRDCHEKKHNRKIFDEEFDADPQYGEDVILSEKVAKIIEAMEYKNLLNISYIDKEGNFTNRVIEPIDLIENHGCNYLFAFCKLRNDNRHFRIARIQDLSLIEK